MARIGAALLLAVTLPFLTSGSTAAAQAASLARPHRAGRAEAAGAPEHRDSPTSAAHDALGSPFAPDAKPSLLGDFTLELTAGTVFPLALGLGARLGHTSGVFLDVWAGGVPDGYASLAGEGASAYGVDAGPRALLQGILSGAGLVRLSVGVRPIRDLGLELSLGYSALIGMPTLARSTIEAATGQSLRPAGNQIGVMLTVHALHLELGYGLVLFDHLLIRATVGAALAVGADFRVNVPAEMRRPGGPVEDVEAGIAGSIPGRVFVPTARLEAGVHF